LNTGTLYSLLIAIIAISISFFLLKSFIKAAIVAIIIVILFRIGWVYNSNDLREKLHLDEFIKPQYRETIYDKYDDYKKKREEDEVIDTKGIDNKINEGINGVNNASEELNKKVQKFLKEKNGE